MDNTPVSPGCAPIEAPVWAKSVPTPADGPLFKSYQAALKSDMTPTCIDGATGFFSSRHDDYVVTLDACLCGNRYRPCKHMYRLAMELGLMPGDFVHDPSKIKHKRTGIELEPALDRVESVSVDLQRVFHSILPALFNGGHVPSGADRGDSLSKTDAAALADANLILWVDDPAGYYLYPDLEFSEFMINRYLCRIFDTDNYINVFGSGTFDVPHGCQVEYTPNKEYAVALPDDRISALLVKRGRNPLDNFSLVFE